jgi:hypothetical protein
MHVSENVWFAFVDSVDVRRLRVQNMVADFVHYARSVVDSDNTT